MSGLFGSAILDVAVGLIFVYLLVSLVVTAGSELVASMLKWRARNLWQGISNLLQDPQGSEDKKKSGYASLATALYDHPLIKRLAHPGKKPSYIPSRTFALVLLDIVSNPAKYLKTELVKLTDSIENTSIKTTVQNGIKEIPDSGLSMAELKTKLSSLISNVPDTGVKSKMEELINKIPSDGSDIGAIINLFPNDDVRKSLRVLWEESGHNIERLKENIEVWFNNAMDRVSGWYKRKSQLSNFIIAIVIAIWVNIDSEVIAKRLSTDSTLRTALAAQAEEYAKQPSNNPTAQPQAGASQQVPGAQPQAPQGGQAPDAGAGATSTKPLDPVEESKKRKAEFDKSIKDIEKLGLPIGWLKEGEVPKGEGTTISELPPWPGWPLYDSNALGNWKKAFAAHGFGWLFTAIAASLGAPFWFDVLNKIITIRSSGKAPEEKPKAPKEEPKPLGPGQTPEEKRVSEQATTALIAGVGALTNWAAKHEDTTPPAEQPPK